MDRQDREQLVDRPAVGQRLEHREVAEVGVGHRFLEVFQFLRHLLEPPRDVADLRAGRPVQALREAAELQRQQPQLEHLQHLVAGRRGIVVALHEPPRTDRAPGVQQVRDRLRQRAPPPEVIGLAARHLEAVERRAAEHVEDQHAVVRGDRAPGFADDHRLWHAARRADARDAVHHVVGVLV